MYTRKKRECVLNQKCRWCRWRNYCTDDIKTRTNNDLKNNCKWFYCWDFEKCKITYKCKHNKE